MIYPNSDLKFRITSNSDRIVLQDIEFSITIKNRYGQAKVFIPKDECFQDSEGEYVFTIESVKKGAHFAYFSGFIDDSDYDKMTQQNTDIQELYVVGSCGVNTGGSIYDCEHEHIVKYQRVIEVDVDGGTYLADKDGNLLLTADGRRIQLKQNEEDMRKVVQLDTLTGDELKKLLEQISQDGKINTFPELVSFLDEVPQGMSLKQYIESIAGGGSQPAYDSVGTEQIKDESIEMEDLSKDVKDTMMTEGDRVTPEELADFQI